MLYLSRLTLTRDPSVEAVRALIDPAAARFGQDPREAGKRSDAHHRLIWSAFAGDADAKRDFLWRAEAKGVFWVLSQRPPGDSPFFDPPDTREFAPDLRTGDGLGFVLRVNATRDRKLDGVRKRVDVVMDAIHGLDKETRREKRLACATEAAQSWMSNQGGRNGFELLSCDVQDYSTATLPGYRGKRRGEPRYGILDLSGRIEVTDPGQFLEKHAKGFGRAKSFGCGLMLIRRG